VPDFEESLDQCRLIPFSADALQTLRNGAINGLRHCFSGQPGKLSRPPVGPIVLDVQTQFPRLQLEVCYISTLPHDALLRKFDVDLLLRFRPLKMSIRPGRKPGMSRKE
jgi:hypothetical protein